MKPINNMSPTRAPYSLFFKGFLVSVLVVFFYLRPLKSPWHPFIAGDGLGYYSYLPAIFIYNDKDFDFKWFNRAHDSNYVYSTFENPEDNLLVKYGNKRINKYYQGLSFIWMPFFLAGHLIAKIFHVPADGYSWPYQWSVGLASLVYLFLGLLFLRKLLFRMFEDDWSADLSTAALFYGTYLFTYAISANSLSHAYSLTFITGFLYYVVSFFKAERQRADHVAAAILCLSIAVCIRPLTGLIVFTIPAFMPKGFMRSFTLPSLKLKWRHGVLMMLTVGVLIYTIAITYRQTGSFLAYTYTNETFDFKNAKFFDALFSYHLGLFVYVPLVFFALAGLLYMSRRSAITLFLFFFGIVFLYSAWWYWPIVKRALIDFYVLPAVFLCSAFAALKTRKRMQGVFAALAVLSVVYFQFKSMQLRRGILDENATYGEVFWRNFFRVNKTNMYLVPPSSILKQNASTEYFENYPDVKKLSSQAHEGKAALRFDSVNYIGRAHAVPYPQFFSEEGFRKVRFSFQSYFKPGVRSVHVFIRFLDQDDKVLQEVPFYLNEEDLPHNRWDYKEFGYELPERPDFDEQLVKRIDAVIWNVENRNFILIDEARIECMLTDRSFETI